MMTDWRRSCLGMVLFSAVFLLTVSARPPADDARSTLDEARRLVEEKKARAQLLQSRIEVVQEYQSARDHPVWLHPRKGRIVVADELQRVNKKIDRFWQDHWMLYAKETAVNIASFFMPGPSWELMKARGVRGLTAWKAELEQYVRSGNREFLDGMLGRDARIPLGYDLARLMADGRKWAREYAELQKEIPQLEDEIHKLEAFLSKASGDPAALAGLLGKWRIGETRSIILIKRTEGGGLVGIMFEGHTKRFNYGSTVWTSFRAGYSKGVFHALETQRTDEKQEIVLRRVDQRTLQYNNSVTKLHLVD